MGEVTPTCNWKVQCRMALIRDGLWRLVNDESETAPSGEDTDYLCKEEAELKRDQILILEEKGNDN